MQEDAHSVVLDFENSKSGFFGVFDGHGGKEVAKFSALYLVRNFLTPFFFQCYLHNLIPDAGMGKQQDSPRMTGMASLFVPTSWRISAGASCEHASERGRTCALCIPQSRLAKRNVQYCRHNTLLCWSLT